MELVDQEYDSIRRHLLGQVTAEEEQQFEEHFMIEANYREKVLMFEEDLIDDYLFDSLSAEDRKAFETHWLPCHADRMEVSKAIRRYGAETPSTRSGLTEIPAGAPAQVVATAKFRRKPLQIGLLAAGFLLLVLVGAALFFWQSKQPPSRGRFSEEIARLNDNSANTQLPDTPVILSPVTLRGATVPKINPDVSGPVVHFLLILPPGQHVSYQVILRCNNPSEEYKVERLNAVSTNSGRSVHFKIPSALLVRGDYALEVSGRTSDGALESVADYSFQISN